MGCSTLGRSRLLDPVEQTLEVYGLDDGIWVRAGDVIG